MNQTSLIIVITQDINIYLTKSFVSLIFQATGENGFEFIVF